MATAPHAIPGSPSVITRPAAPRADRLCEPSTQPGTGPGQRTCGALASMGWACAPTIGPLSPSAMDSSSASWAFTTRWRRSVSPPSRPAPFTLKDAARCRGAPPAGATKKAIAAAFGAFVGDTAGMTEAATIFMFECIEEPGGCHIIESDFIEEVLDPDTLRPVPYGETGVRVMTSLGPEGIQAFRYWTNDLVVKRAWSECECGRTWDWYESGIRGRQDDMRKVRGVFFIPVMVEDVVRAFPEVDEFKSSLRTIEELDTLVVRIEPRPDVPSEQYGELAERVGAQIKRQISLTPIVEVATPGGLPRFEMKARRFQEERSSPATHA